MSSSKACIVSGQLHGSKPKRHLARLELCLEQASLSSSKACIVSGQ